MAATGSYEMAVDLESRSESMVVDEPEGDDPVQIL